MKLKRAKLIAALIADLDKDCVYTDYVAEVKPNPYDDTEFSVVLFSKGTHRNQLCDLICFGRILEELATKVHMCYYNYYIELS